MNNKLKLIIAISGGLVVLTAAVIFIFAKLSSYLITDKWKDYDECGF